MSRNGTQFFNKAKHVVLNDSTITNVERDFIHYEIQGDFHNHESKEGLRTLSNVIATDALHDSIDRSTMKCHPGTREKLISMILSWIKDANQTHEDILWIHGSAGSGKSTIMQTIAEICFNCTPESRHPGGSFFFSRKKPRREDDRYLYTTLSYQLAMCDPELGDQVNRAMAVDPILHTRKADLQIRKLIFEPLQQVEFLPTQVPFVIIDGVDECHNHKTQKQILDLIADALKAHGPLLRFIITTRSESHIRDIFDLPEFECRARKISLDSFNPKHDIRLFLEQGFQDIAKRNKAIMARLKTQWPQPSDVDYLVEKSTGQFLYAATVLKFVGAELLHPVKQLQIVLDSPHASSDLYSNIDELYTQILKTCPEREDLLRIFGLLLTLHCPQPPEVYDDILGLEPGDTTFILSGLHSVIRFPNLPDDAIERRVFERRLEYDKTRGLRFHHASFQDFILEKKRSKEFFVDLSGAHADLAKSGFNLMTKWISSPWRNTTENEDFPARETWGYLKHHLGNHLAECQTEVREAILQDLLEFQIVFPPPISIKDPIWDHSFDALHSMVTVFALMLVPDDDGKQQLLSPTNFHSEHSHWAQDFTIHRKKIIPRENDGVSEAYLKYCGLLDEFYKFALSESSEVLNFLDKLPGLVTDTSPIMDSWLHSLFGIDLAEISSTMQRDGKFFHKWKNAFWNRHFNMGGNDYVGDVVLLLNQHFASFLCDKDRAGEFYRDPETRFILDYSHIISMIFGPDWLEITRSRNSITHLDGILKSCLESISLKQLASPPDGHPIIKLMDVLKELRYDIPCLQEAPVLNVDLVWSATRRLLEWIQRQHESSRKDVHGISKKASHKIRETLAQMSINIYNQILQVKTLGTGGNLVSICDPFLVAISRDFASETPSILSPPPSPALPEQLIISETLLFLSGIRSSLLGFLTKPDRARRLHFSPEVYHTQFAEMCLEHCNPSVSDISRDWRTLPAHKEWRFHLVRAKPSQNILSRLRSIPFGPWLAEGLPTGDSKAKVNSILAIIKWLEKNPENPPDISERWKKILADLKRLKRWEPSRHGHPSPSVPNSPNSTYFRDGSIFATNL